MPEPTITQVFGLNTVQDGTTITLSKTALGITDADARAEQIFTAIILKAESYLNASSQSSNPDVQITIENGFASLVTRNSAVYREKVKTVRFQKLDGEPDEVIPGDY